MKTKLFLFAVCTLLVSAGAFGKVKSSTMLSGESLTDFGKYQIVKADLPMKVQGTALETYDLKYENSNSVFRVGVLKVEGCTTYIVRSAGLEMEYRCANGVFGAKKMDRQLRELPAGVNDKNLDRADYFAQKVIVRDNASKDYHLGLIACYFPKLIKDDYQAELINN